MSFLLKLGRKKKKKNSKNSWDKLNNETKRLYFTAEFQSLGDMTKNGTMNLDEFYRLMMLLAFPEDRDGAMRVWKSRGLSDGSRMSLDQYISMMFDQEIEAKTSTWRRLFSEIDTDGNATASRSEVLHGLKKMGIDVTPEMRAKVCGMDDDKDGTIGYAEFLKVQLKQ